MNTATKRAITPGGWHSWHSSCSACISAFRSVPRVPHNNTSHTWHPSCWHPSVLRSVPSLGRSLASLGRRKTLGMRQTNGKRPQGETGVKHGRVPQLGRLDGSGPFTPPGVEDRVLGGSERLIASQLVTSETQIGRGR